MQLFWIVDIVGQNSYHNCSGELTQLVSIVNIVDQDNYGSLSGLLTQLVRVINIIGQGSFHSWSGQLKQLVRIVMVVGQGMGSVVGHGGGETAQTTFPHTSVMFYRSRRQHPMLSNIFIHTSIFFRNSLFGSHHHFCQELFQHICQCLTSSHNTIILL